MEQTMDVQRKALVEMARAIGDAIKELGQVPSGHLYARLMGSMSLETYDVIIDALVRLGRVRMEPSHMLVWIGGR